MLWKDRRESSNVEDQRRSGVGRAGAMGGSGLIIGAIIVYLMGGNPLAFLMENAGQVSQGSGQSGPIQAAPTQQDEDRRKFVSVVLADTEDVWHEQFKKVGKTYQEPKLVLFNGSVRSACGSASSAMGPFYCPGDEKVYIDLGFFDQLSGSMGAKGDFAEAYVIGHEVGHHVQNRLGIERQMRNQQQGLDAAGKNKLSVALELQADCLAGVWAKQTEKAKNVIEPGDIDEALTAASAVGDDTLQKKGQGYVVPDSFTHGSAAQRIAAFRRGFDGGELQNCMQ